MHHLRAIVFLTALTALSPPATVLGDSGTPVPPRDPAQSLRYWQEFVVAPGTDAPVARAHQVFDVLLRAWDSARLEPALHVVDSSAGPWAASLADGNILLSRAAIDTCFDFGAERGAHLLAFVLAHELAHQRADDLWHQKFFRLAGTQTPAVQARLVEGLNSEVLADIGKREARADHDGLVLMSSVGFDPYQVIDERDFFTAWVESVWNESCAQAHGGAQACREAQTRALRTRVQLGQVAAQATLYELGLQSLVAARYAEARRLLVAYGRDYPSRAVLSSLGTSYLAEALEAHRELVRSARLQAPDFYYPLILDAQPRAAPVAFPANARGSADAALPPRIRALLAEANRYFERALRLEPRHRPTYLLLAISHLLEGNPYLVRGVLQGRYRPAFGNDAAAGLLLAMTSALEGRHDVARREFDDLLRDLDTLPSALPHEVLYYATYHNAAALAAMRGDAVRAHTLWQDLAARARVRNQGLLFRLAVARVAPEATASRRRTAAGPWLVAGARPGVTLARAGLRDLDTRRDQIWVNGSPMQVYRTQAGARLVVDDAGTVRHAWQVRGSGQAGTLAVGDSADRAVKALGLPDRRLHLLAGDYLAYDELGVAVHVVAGTIEGWFLY